MALNGQTHIPPVGNPQIPLRILNLNQDQRRRDVYGREGADLCCSSSFIISRGGAGRDDGAVIMSPVFTSEREVEDGRRVRRPLCLQEKEPLSHLTRAAP